MAKVYNGSCLCGDVRFKIEGEFENFYLCHCNYCRKDTGSAHAANLFSTTAKLDWTSGKDKIKTFTLPATRHTKSFCLNCGSPVPSVNTNESFLTVPAGCLDSKLSLRPNAHIFVSSRADWDEDLETLPMMDGIPS